MRHFLKRLKNVITIYRVTYNRVTIKKRIFAARNQIRRNALQLDRISDFLPDSHAAILPDAAEMALASPAGRQLLLLHVVHSEIHSHLTDYHTYRLLCRHPY